MAIPLTIEKMVYGGDGLARFRPAEPASAASHWTKERRGKAVLVPFVLEGEQVEARIIEERRGFSRAEPEKILAPSIHRVQARCPYFGDCGGCQYQHATYEHQLETRSKILRETLWRTAKISWEDEIFLHPSPPWNYRNRTRMKLQAEPFAIGYYRHSSHDLLPIRQCPISSPLINRALEAIWNLGDTGRLKLISEIEFFADSADTRLLLEAYLLAGSANHSDLKNLAESLAASISEISSIVFFASEGARRFRAISVFGDQYLAYSTASANYRVSAGSFFQTNRFMTDALVRLVTAGRSGHTAIDLYAGVGLFTVPLAKTFETVMAVESDPFSFADLECNVPANVLARCANSEVFLAKVRDGLSPPDYIVVDPPRAGLGENVSKLLANAAAPQMTYVSCDPATLARDLARLDAHGYRIAAVHLVDLFPQTFHIETVVFLSR